MARPSIYVDTPHITTHGLHIDNRNKIDREGVYRRWLAYLNFKKVIFSNYADHVETFSGELLTSGRLVFMNQARLSQQI